MPHVHLLEVIGFDSKGNPTETVDHGFHFWPFASFPEPGEQFVLISILWGCYRRVWFPDTESVGMYVECVAEAKIEGGDDEREDGEGRSRADADSCPVG